MRASMIVTYNIKLFRTGADRHNGILMSLLLLVAETIKKKTQIREPISPAERLAITLRF